MKTDTPNATLRKAMRVPQEEGEEEEGEKDKEGKAGKAFGNVFFKKEFGTPFGDLNKEVEVEYERLSRSKT